MIRAAFRVVFSAFLSAFAIPLLWFSLRDAQISVGANTSAPGRVGLFIFGISLLAAAAWVLVLYRFFRGLDQKLVTGGLLLFGFGWPFVGFILGRDGQSDSWLMAHLVGIPFALAISLGGIAVLLRSRRTVRFCIKDAAQIAGVPVLGRSTFRAPTALGTTQDGLAVSIVDGDIDVEVRITGSSIPRDLALMRERLVELAPETLATGDAAFDHEVFVHGDAVRTMALLGHETRNLVRRAIAEGVTVQKGTVCWSAGADWHSQLGERTRAALVLARALSHPGELRAGLRDPEPGVRKVTLALLLEGKPDDGAGLLSAALADTAGLVRKFAADRILADPDASADLRARAEVTLHNISAGTISLAETAGTGGEVSLPREDGAVSLVTKK